MINIDTRLRVGRAIGKDETEVAQELVAQLRERGHPDVPPVMVTDGQGGYREAILETWGRAPPYQGRGRPPTQKQPQPDWYYLPVIERRSDGRLVGLTIKVVYGDAEEVRQLLGGHTAYVERTHLTSRQTKGRLVRKTLSFSKELEIFQAACAWEDITNNLTRPLKTLRQEVNPVGRRWLPRTPAMTVKLTDHI